jgi:glutamate carboxypeptidase
MVRFLFLLTLAATAYAQSQAQIRDLARQQRQPYLDTLRELVSIESGSSDYEGVTRIGVLIGDKLKALGGDVESVAPAADMPRYSNTPARIANTVVARFRGRGTKRILLLSHMDTVYQKGMLAQQPFRVEGDRAYGLGIADDKHGVALTLHVLAALKALNYDAYGLITVLVSPDEEIGSNAERDLIAKLAEEHDLVLSYEAALTQNQIRLATTGVQTAILTVKGRASHAGNAPEQGRNALYELAHQVLQLRDLTNPAKDVKVNWTMASAGSVFNAIPADASAVGDMRTNDLANFADVENTIRERIQEHIIPDTTVSVRFERLYPPMRLREQSLPVAEHAARVMAETGGALLVNRVASGSGTDAAFAALRTKAPVLEGLGLMGFGAHSNDAEYILLDSIEPRLYLSTRLIMDFADGKVQ